MAWVFTTVFWFAFGKFSFLLMVVFFSLGEVVADASLADFFDWFV